MGGDKGSPATPLRVRGLKAPLYCRPGTSDVDTFRDTFWGKYHRPPDDLAPIRSILDLGSNVGFTMLDFVRTYPKARILGIELDAGNYEMCSGNIQPYANRCRVLHGAAWYEDGEVTYGGEAEWAFRVKPDGPAKVRAWSISSLIAILGGSVDFLKMDIEGAEQDVLARCDGWIRSVRCLKTEVHPPYTVEECLRRLGGLGFSCRRDPRHRAAVVALAPRFLQSD